MRQWRVGTFSMGISLIVLGIIMLATQLAGVSALQHIIKWWPVLLITLGGEILVYIYASKQENPKVKFDILSIVLVSVIIFFSVGAYAITSVLNGASAPMLSQIFHIYRYESTFKKNIILDTHGKDKFVIDSSRGNIKIIKGMSNKIEVDANIIIKNNDEAYAKTVADALIELNESDDLRLISKAEQYSNNQNKIQNIRMNIIIKVPEKMNLEIANKFGDLNVEGIIAAAKINNAHGNVEVRYMGGDLSVENAYGNIKIDNIKGKTEINNQNGSTEVKRIGSSLLIRNAFGEVKVEDVKGNADVSNSNSPIYIKQVDGDVILDSEYSEIVLSNIKGSVKAKGNNGNITAKNMDGDVKILNQFGGIELVNANKAVNITNENGKVSFSTEKLLEKDVEIKTSFEDISIKLPKEQQGKFKAFTEYGTIKNGLELKVKEELNKQTLDEVKGNDKIKINLETQNGNIRIQ
ncbi:MAG: hypothetical protein N2645_02790 [Clostridia bacterium]|nr:hypothetical protein [Clostridia bacterium]